MGGVIDFLFTLRRVNIMKKKVLAMILALAMGTAALSGCQTVTTEEAGETSAEPAAETAAAETGAFSTLLSLYLSFLYCHTGTWKTPRKKMITNVAQGGL
jgi:uncharacterized protein YceK